MTSISERAISDVWRENKSKDPGVDLASVLDSCRILAQSLIPNVEVTFSGEKSANTDKTKIILSAKDLGEQFPVPGEMVDVKLGETVHKIGHLLFSPDMEQLGERLAIRSKVQRFTNEVQTFRSLIGVLEDIYIDHIMTAYPGYRDYLTRERRHTLGKFNVESITKPLENQVTRTDILNALVYTALYGGQLPPGITQENMMLLGGLIDIASKMATKKITRDNAIISSWKILNGVPETLTDDSRGFTPPPVPQPQPDKTEPEAKSTAEQAREDAKKEQERQSNAGDEPEDDGTVDNSDDEENEDDNGESSEPAGEENQGEAEPAGEGKSEKAGEVNEAEGGDGEPADSEPDNPESDNDGTKGNGDGKVKAEGGDSDPGIQSEPIEPVVDKTIDLSRYLDALVNDKTRLDQDIAEAVSDAVVGKRSDLTQLVSLLAKDSESTIIAYTPEEDAMSTIEARSHTAEAEEKLRHVIQEYKLRRTADYRGLTSGRVSTNRLHRVAYGDQRVFQRRERPNEIDMSICLLMDLSGSMRRQEDMINQVVCAMSDSLTKEKVEFIAMGYSTGGSTVSTSGMSYTDRVKQRNSVYVSRLYDHETNKVNLKFAHEWGSTPSYEGLAAAVAQLLRLTGNKKKVLFHFTDGSPNDGYTSNIPNLLKKAREMGIIDIHVALGSYNEDGFRQLYGNRVIQIDNIGQLPVVVESELRTRLGI